MTSADQPRKRYERAKRSLRSNHDQGLIHTDDYERICALDDAYNDDVNTVLPPRDPQKGRRKKTRSPGTRTNWMNRFILMARHVQLSDATAHEINSLMDDLRDGLDYRREGRRKKSTVKNYQHAARMFYQYHDDLGVNSFDINIYDVDGATPVDPEDMLSRDEIIEAGNACTEIRDRMGFHMLLYTGMRNNAFRLIRWKDVDIENGRYRFNPEVNEGLKNVDKPLSYRPLLGAKGALAEWKRVHPDPKPENYVMTALPNYNRVDPTKPVTSSCLRGMMLRIKSNTSIEKPMHPHMMRHNYVTILKLDYEVPNSTVKFLIGHKPNSDVMESTYQHLKDRDHIRRVEVAAGIREEDETENENRLVPDQCDVCGREMQSDFEVCPKCGTPYNPVIEEKQRRARQDARNDMAKAGASGDKRAMEAINTLANELDVDPDVLSDAVGLHDD